MREQNLTDHNHINQADFDKPIEKPFDELPSWFVEMLNARLTTKRFEKNRNDVITHPNRRRRAA